MLPEQLLPELETGHHSTHPEVVDHGVDGDLSQDREVLLGPAVQFVPERDAEQIGHEAAKVVEGVLVGELPVPYAPWVFREVLEQVTAVRRSGPGPLFLAHRRRGSTPSSRGPASTWTSRRRRRAARCRWRRSRRCKYRVPLGRFGPALDRSDLSDSWLWTPTGFRGLRAWGGGGARELGWVVVAAPRTARGVAAAALESRAPTIGRPPPSCGGSRPSPHPQVRGRPALFFGQDPTQSSATVPLTTLVGPSSLASLWETGPKTSRPFVLHFLDSWRPSWRGGGETGRRGGGQAERGRGNKGEREGRGGGGRAQHLREGGPRPSEEGRGGASTPLPAQWPLTQLSVRQKARLAGAACDASTDADILRTADQKQPRRTQSNEHFWAYSR